MLFRSKKEIKIEEKLPIKNNKEEDSIKETKSDKKQPIIKKKRRKSKKKIDKLINLS